METRFHFREKLKLLETHINQMGALTYECIERAVIAFLNQNLDLAQHVILDDKDIDLLETNIENEIISLIALESPVAGDLREAVACLKIVSRFERMGDYAVHIAKALIKLKNLNKTPVKIFSEYIQKMSGICLEMLKASIKAFNNRDIKQAEQTALRDNEINQIHDLFLKNLYDSKQNIDMPLEEVGIMLFMARYLERLGDQAVSICEYIVYSVTGDHIELK